MSRRSLWCVLGVLVAGCSAPEPPPVTPPEVTADTGAQGELSPVTITTTPPRVCEEPGRRELFVFDMEYTLGEPPKPIRFWGAGVIVGDFDQDGYVDVISPGFWRTAYHRGGPDHLVDVSDELAGLPLAGASGGSAADFDGDGDLDVIVTRFGGHNVLLRNDEGRFVDVTEGAGLSMLERRSMASSWGDLDRDGDLDLFIGNYGFLDESQEDPDHTDFEPAEPSFLYINQGDGTFVDRSDLIPQEAHDGYTFTGGFIDADVDGWPDLYVVNDFGASFPSRMLWNREGRFVLDDQGAGLDLDLTGMGLAIGDVNGDERPDFIVSAWKGDAFMQSSPQGYWIDWAAAVGVMNDLSRGQKVAWGVSLVDMDNDGDLDAPMSYGYLESGYTASLTQPDALYVQGADGIWKDDGPALAFNHPTMGRGFVPVDLDNNGFLDIVKRDLAGPSLVYRSRCDRSSWLRVRLHQEGMNRDAIGARVRVVSGERHQMGWMLAGTVNHASGGPPDLHFGLGDHDQAEEVWVFWPDGAVSKVERVPGRTILDVWRTP